MSKPIPLYVRLARCIVAIENCRKSGNGEWLARHESSLDKMARDLPSGSGIDSGCQIDLDKSTGEKIVINTGFHHMHESGMYDGWSHHTVTVRASLGFGIDIRISGRDRNGIKEYLGEVFDSALREVSPEFSGGE